MTLKVLGSCLNKALKFIHIAYQHPKELGFSPLFDPDVSQLWLTEESFFLSVKPKHNTEGRARTLTYEVASGIAQP